MSAFEITITRTPALSPWPTNTLVSFNQSGATIHIMSTSDELRSVQIAARKLATTGLRKVSLVGRWETKEQWAFAASFVGVEPGYQIEWAAGSDDLQALRSAFEALMFSRQLVNHTPEDMSPMYLAETAADWLHSLAPSVVDYSFIIGDELKTAGWNGLYDVGRGSERPPVMLVLDYNPSGDPNAAVDVALVGKGITFDSGGYSIKSSEGMLDMKCDMGGAATVTGALGLCILNKIHKRVKLFLCCAENLISGHAYKLGDVIKYKNGVSVEIVNTDAEGRLVLADGLMAASETKAPLIIDAATLTGAAVMAVGKEYNAIFTLDSSLQKKALHFAEQEKELHWPLPLMPWHQYQCPSPFADTANSRPVKGGGAGGASNAAGFLSRFVDNDGAGWIHFDLAAAYNRNGTETMPNGATGLGIKTIAALVADNKE